ncbi:MAG: hypothetical protein MJ177_02510 [Clostridia bacterium]|nr:hypothetical protein [Clostridia bacterium]
MEPFILKKHTARKTTVMPKDSPAVPEQLFIQECKKPDLDGFQYPLPVRKCEYTCYAEGENGVLWLGSTNGVTRFDPGADYEEDKIMYFSARRHLEEKKVEKILADGDGAWVLTGEYVTHIEMPVMPCEQKAEILLDETNKYVMRRGMVSQKELRERRVLESAYPYTSSDNDGSFTSAHAAGEVFHYAVYRDKYGENHPKTVKARADATKAVEACLLLMYIHGREEGFVARSYHLPDEPVPDDGFFYERKGDKAYCVKTTASEKTGRTGEAVDCTHKIPERLAKLYTDLGYTEDGIVYKADTSSDEITSHFMQMWVAHDILGSVDPELDDIIKDACTRTMTHIINCGFELHEHNGKPTTWAKWSKRYFENDMLGYVDAPLNAAELLSYLKVTMHITGEKGIWQQTYDSLIKEGYADLTTKHFDRFFQGAVCCDCAPEEDLMYGDNMLATLAFWMLCSLEKDEALLKQYRDGYRSWAPSLLREHMPGYDFPYLLSVPDAGIDVERDALWFYRNELSRLCSSVVLKRHDVPMKKKRNKDEDNRPEISALLPQDERFITKYDRNPFNYNPESWHPETTVEGCYVFTFAYWLGRYYGIIGEEE